MKTNRLSRLQIILLTLAVVALVLGFLSDSYLWLKIALYVVGIGMIWYAGQQVKPR